MVTFVQIRNKFNNGSWKHAASNIITLHKYTEGILSMSFVQSPTMYA